MSIVSPVIGYIPVVTLCTMCESKSQLPILIQNSNISWIFYDNHAPFLLPFDYFNQILNAILPGWARFRISPFDPKLTGFTLEVAMRFHLLNRSIKLQLSWYAYLSRQWCKCHDNFRLTDQSHDPNKSFTTCEYIGTTVSRNLLGLRKKSIHIKPGSKSTNLLR